MKGLKKAVAFVLAATMVMGTVGCGKKDDAPEKKPQAEQGEKPEKEPEKEEFVDRTKEYLHRDTSKFDKSRVPSEILIDEQVVSFPKKISDFCESKLVRIGSTMQDSIIHYYEYDEWNSCPERDGKQLIYFNLRNREETEKEYYLTAYAENFSNPTVNEAEQLEISVISGNVWDAWNYPNPSRLYLYGPEKIMQKHKEESIEECVQITPNDLIEFYGEPEFVYLKHPEQSEDLEFPDEYLYMYRGDNMIMTFIITNERSADDEVLNFSIMDPRSVEAKEEMELMGKGKIY